MKNKLMAGLLASFMVFGGAIAVGAAKNDSRVDDSIHQEDKVKSSSNVSTLNNHKVEVEIEHGHTIIKQKTKNRNDDGRHHGRHSGNDDSKPGDGKHKNRHSGDDD
ncbi:hypothetical protein [Neobacillus sp. LXY-1]|uniref:hypothetical protein n=1 Tax=Neobacillus sp. LXY-1 TaxID=3379133 RepID=UPI003EE2DD23